MKVLLIGEIHPEAKRLLAENTELNEVGNEEFVKAFPDAEKSKISGTAWSGIEAVALRTFTRLGKEELDKLPNLKYVVSCSVGLDNLALEELKKRNIRLVHCPGSNANSVAEHTLHLILSLIRKRKPFFELKNKTVGIIGLGCIGKLVAKKLSGLEARIIAFDVIPQEPEVLKELKAEMKSFEEVIKGADILTIHVPLNEATRNLIDEEAFARMKKGVFFINTSRAEVVDEEALLKYSRKFRGIGLDVYSDALKEKLSRRKAILTKHVAAQGEDSFKEMCLRPVKEFLESQG